MKLRLRQSPRPVERVRAHPRAAAETALPGRSPARRRNHSRLLNRSVPYAWRAHEGRRRESDGNYATRTMLRQVDWETRYQRDQIWSGVGGAYETEVRYRQRRRNAATSDPPGTADPSHRSAKPDPGTATGVLLSQCAVHARLATTAPSAPPPGGRHWRGLQPLRPLLASRHITRAFRRTRRSAFSRAGARPHRRPTASALVACWASKTRCAWTGPSPDHTGGYRSGSRKGEHGSGLRGMAPAVWLDLKVLVCSHHLLHDLRQPNSSSALNSAGAAPDYAVAGAVGGLISLLIRQRRQTHPQAADHGSAAGQRRCPEEFIPLRRRQIKVLPPLELAKASQAADESNTARRRTVSDARADKEVRLGY